MLNKFFLTEEEIEQEKMKDFIRELDKGMQILLCTYGKEELLKEINTQSDTF